MEDFGSNVHLNACDHEFRLLAPCVDCALSTAIGYKMKVEASLSQREREGTKRENMRARKKQE
jgi:hypothetical protein